MIGANLPAVACNASRGTKSKPRPALVAKSFRKLWSTNWRIKPSVSLGAPNPTSRPPCSSPCSRLFATPRLQVFLLIKILPSTFSNTSVISPSPSRASPLLFGKPKGWCQLQGLPYTSSSHTLSDVLPTLTSPRWLCTTLIYKTPLDKPWPLGIMKTFSLNNWQPSALWTSKMYPTTVLGIAFSTGLPAWPLGATNFLLMMSVMLSEWLLRCLTTKLLILTPHNDTVDDLIDALGLPPDNPIYRQQILPNTLQEFTRTDHRGKTYTPLLENVTLREIHARICNNPTLLQNLERRATIDTIVQVALEFPNIFSSYCTISNTVKAIGIGGVASVFVSCKISDFLTLTKEAQARNLVALTRSKGLCILLLPSTDKFPNSSLHFLRTLCAFRHGMFSIELALPPLI